ncbi:hypothetical protein CRG98_021166 [Punica granatum]|uniref:Uncharacterized protein n=1 Tax=Punica granatum TaxID=22663 RepID=A0A2I0JQ31_PUNGR|nr:hypothetical protein CRG98_021166 [Punica granatum]
MRDQSRLELSPIFFLLDRGVHRLPKGSRPLPQKLISPFLAKIVLSGVNSDARPCARAPTAQVRVPAAARLPAPCAPARALACAPA